MSSPLERSKALLKEDGWLVWKVEFFNRWSMRTVDAFNMLDLICIRSDRSGVMGLQVCGEDVAIHVRKILSGYAVPGGKHKGEIVPPNPYIKVWLEAGNPFFIWGWRLRKHEGTRDTWQLRQVEAVLKDGAVEFHEIPDTSELKL